jgi:SAM-dependent methyltransferase
MYRILPSPARNRVLELCFDTPSILAGFSWPGEYAIACELYPGGTEHASRSNGRDCIADYRRDLPFSPRSFDLVICHQSLDRLAATDQSMRNPSALAGFVRRISTVLVEGGVLALCVQNTTALTRWSDASMKRVRGNSGGIALSTEGWRRLLVNSGLQRIQTFTVLPAGDAPLRLINTDTDLSRLGFRRELESIRGSISLAGYVARSTLVAMSLYRHWERAILAWGHRS